MTTPTLQIDQIANALVAAPGVSVEMLNAFPGGAVGPYSTSSYADIHSSLESTFTIPVAGTYRVQFSHQIFTSGTGCDGRLRFIFDEAGFNGHAEQTVSDDSGTAFYFNTGPAGVRPGITHAFTVELAAGVHKMKPQWNFVAGAAGLEAGTVTAFHAVATLLSGSGAGGTLVSRAEKTADQTGIASGSFVEITELSHTITVFEQEDFDLEYMIIPTVPAAATKVLAYRVDGGSWLPLEGESASSGFWTAMSGVHSISLAKGEHTIDFGIAHDGASTLTVFGAVAFQGLTWRSRTAIRQHRGGLVPVQQDGSDVVGQPRALNFVGGGVSVSDDGYGAADISLPAAVTAEGVGIDLIDQKASSTYTTTSSSFADINAEFNKTVSVPATGLYRITMVTSVYSTGGEGGIRWQLTQDGTPLTSDDQKFDLYTASSAGQQEAKTFVFFANLSAGSHEFKLRWKKVVGAGTMTINSDTHLNVNAQLVTGSGAGGTIADSDSETALISGITDASETVLGSVTVDAVEGEDILVCMHGFAQKDSSTLYTCFSRLYLDGVLQKEVQYRTAVAFDRGFIGFTYILEGVSGGSRTIEWRAIAFTGETGDVRNVRMQVFRSRGGLVPVRSDGALVLDKPAALDFGAGLDVTVSGGAAIIDVLGAADVLKLPEQSADPSASPDDGYLYTKDLSGVTELYYRDDAGSITRITDAGALAVGLDGYALLVSINDAIPGYLSEKLLAGLNIRLTELNDGGAELLEVATSEYLKLPEQLSDPTPFADDGYLYTKDADGYSELYYMDNNGMVTQVTLDGYLNTVSGVVLDSPGGLRYLLRVDDAGDLFTVLID